MLKAFSSSKLQIKKMFCEHEEIKSQRKETQIHWILELFARIKMLAQVY